jgi:two-component system nitrate/nitrite response regulator NarL
MTDTETEARPPALLLIDDHPLRRASLARFLSDLPQTGGPGFRIQEAAWTVQPDAVAGGACLLLVNLGGAPAAEPAMAEKLRALVELAGDVPVTVLSDHDTAEEAVAVAAAGARGFLTTLHEPRLLLSALRFIVAGGSVFPPQALLAGRDGLEAERGAEKSGTGLRALTARQRDVLRLLGQGQSNKRIAIELRMCESTVKVHVRQIMRKLRAANRTQAALVGRELLRDAEVEALPEPPPAPLPAPLPLPQRTAGLPVPGAVGGGLAPVRAA